MDVEVIDGVSVVRIDNPPVNALDLALVQDAVATINSLQGPIVITGSGKCFSAGVDLRAVADGGREYTDRFLDVMPSAFLAVFDYPGPVVAAVNGHAIAGGCVVAMAADVRIMGDGLMGLTEVAVGVPFPVAALEICRYVMGPSVTGAMLRADNVDAQTALQRGWVDAVVPAGDVLSEAIATARTLGNHSPFAYAATKAQLHRHARAAIDAGAEIDPQVRAGWLSDETFARIESFLNGLK
jgi:enoyl-CoA hydratase